MRHSLPGSRHAMVGRGTAGRARLDRSRRSSHAAAGERHVRAACCRNARGVSANGADDVAVMRRGDLYTKMRSAP